MITIIVPVYNSVQSLSRCIESILAQTYADFELLLINDGSIDGSAEICESYAHQDLRIRVFHQANQGVSAARNLGLDNAHGEYLFFVDSDDTLATDALELLAKRSDHDLVVGGVAYQGIRQDLLLFSEKSYSTRTIGELLSESLHSLLLLSSWAKLFRKDIITTNHLRFEKEVTLGEDTLFLQSYLLQAQSLYCVEKPIYHYYLLDANFYTKYKLNSKHTLSALNLLMTRYDSLTANFDFSCEEYKKYILFHYSKAFEKYFLECSKDNNTLFDEFQSVMHSPYFSYLLEVRKNFCRSNKIRFLLLKWGCFRLLFLFCLWRKRFIQ